MSRPGAREWAPAVLLALVLWLTFLDFPAFTAGPELDQSWQQALGHFLRHRFQAGVDYVFSYGPLGYFCTRAYDPDLFTAKYSWELSLKLVMAIVLVRAGWCLKCTGVRALFFAAVFFLPDHPDVLYPFFILLLGLSAFGPSRPSWARLLLAGSLLAVLALVKINLFFFGLAALVVLTLALIAEGRRRAALLAAGSFVVCLLAVWALTGQALAHLSRYLRLSWQISEGYVEAMAVEGDPRHVLLALAILLLLAAALATYGVRALARVRSLLLLALLTLSLFLQWKHSFVRQGSHTVNFFAFAALVVLLFPTVHAAERPSRWRVLLAGGALVLALGGRFALDPLSVTPLRLVSERLQRVGDNVRAVLAPAELRERLDAARTALRAEWELPRVRAVVGSAACDLLSCEQGVLLLNDLNYRPRPVFQSYKAYTPELLALNARFFAGDRAPEYVLLALEPIDGRVPASEDGLALLEILRRYRPVLTEKSFLLLRRAPGPEGSEEKTIVVDRTVTLGEELRLEPSGEASQVIRLDVRHSAWGRLRTLLYKPAPLFLRMQLDNGESKYQRLIPDLARSGFLLNPFLEDKDDLLRLYECRPGKRVTALAIVASPDSFRDEVRVEIRE